MLLLKQFLLPAITLLSASATAQQIIFPPVDGPCPQNAGAAPPTCSDELTCISIPSAGICTIQTLEGFPPCGCCEPEVVNCAYCGGDAGGGICNGIGPRMIGYQGCPCSTNDGEMPPYYRSKVCPEDFERPTQKCGDPECDDDKFDAGICSAKRFTGEGGIYRHCSCCPRDEELFCEDCGGDDGDAKCLGIPQYRGTQYQGCLCTPGSDGDSDPFPFPIPPFGFPIPPPLTPRPKIPCEDHPLSQCSECDGKDNWCQSGEAAGCPCLNDCSNEGEEPDCADALCEGNNDEHKCTVGPDQGCKCKENKECPTGVDIPLCEASNCGGATNSSTISACQGEFGTEKNKDCTCFQLFKDMEGERPFSDAEIDAQQTFIDNLINDKSEGCVEGFTNSTVLTIETTGNFISLNFEPDVFPEMFENGNSQWRIVDITGFAKEWIVRFHPSETIAGTSTDGRVTFDFVESIQAIERVSVEAPLPFEADGSCSTTIKIAVDAACAGNLPAEPEIAEPNRSCPPPQPIPMPPEDTPTPPPPQPDPYPTCKDVDIPGLTCQKDCCGFVPCGDWCIDNCGGLVC